LKIQEKSWYPGWESNPHEEKSPEDFKSSASAIPPPGHRQCKSNKDKYLLQHSHLHTRPLRHSGVGSGVGWSFYQVFLHVTRPSCIFTAVKTDQSDLPVRVHDLSHLKPAQKAGALQESNALRFESQIQQSAIKLLPGKIIPVRRVAEYEIWFEIKRRLGCVELHELVDADGIQRGVSPDLKEAFVVSKSDAERLKLEKGWLRKVVLGGDIKRFSVNYQDRLVIYVTRNDDPTKFKHICRFIDSHKSEITCKEVKTGKHSIYALHRARDARIFTKQPKLVGVITEDEPVLARDDEGLYATDGAYLFGVKEGVEINYVLGLLNSTLLRFLYRLIATEEKRTLAQVKPAVLGTLPIRMVDRSVAHDCEKQKKIVDLVEDLTTLFRKHQGKLKGEDLLVAAKKIRRIDDLVFELYELSDKDRNVIDVEMAPAPEYVGAK
jgi:hypothetical protein